jgi:site-specific DNA-cytosine methylase
MSDASAIHGRPSATDWCCGDGGMTQGMLTAGFRVTGVDIVRRPKYPAAARHVLADLTRLEADDLPRTEWDHWSPPCTRFSQVRGNRKVDPPTDADLDLLRAAIRLRDARRPRYWSIENVRGAVPWFTPLLGAPRLSHGPFVFWTSPNFPAFLVARAGLKKNLNVNHAKSHRAWTRAFLPIELVGPMAQAVAAELAALQGRVVA